MKITIQIGSFKQEYILALTDAPKDFDYDSLIELRTYETPLEGDLRTKGPARLVLIPTAILEVQTARNHSGIWVTWTEVAEDLNLLEHDIEQILLARLHQP